ncbi:hypothetical protein E2A64_03415 [Pseudohoeflea suaedae]|uniref:Uncharacterized protein n=1 Tax=Pseudohoeflea suaedae TaxID=877384 RepID=A0A4R5PMJ8_9HYPH|nr:hypothetical protein [Pseudohoeflea suaedae]TDH38183.1 hypothetical protein E2A64_03415 [Pseudohoeflea suaedae]
MPTYELDISIDQAGLTALTQAGQSVTIVKQSSGGKPTAWISFTPQMNNVITWTEQYSVYSSTTNAQAGATIRTSSVATAIGGSSYTLNNSGFFDKGISGRVGPTQYQIINADPDLMIGTTPMVTAGLLQGASVNGKNVSAPLCAAGVLYNQTALFTPIETIMVFTSSYSDNGIVISQVAGNALTVEYTTNNTAAIAYNDQNNQFIAN